MIGIKSAPRFRKDSRPFFRLSRLQPNSGRLRSRSPVRTLRVLSFSELLCLRNRTRPVPRLSRETASSQTGFLRLAFVLQSQQNPSRGSFQTKSLHYAVFKVPAAPRNASFAPLGRPSALLGGVSSLYAGGTFAVKSFLTRPSLFFRSRPNARRAVPRHSLLRIPQPSFTVKAF